MGACECKGKHMRMGDLVCGRGLVLRMPLTSDGGIGEYLCKRASVCESHAAAYFWAHADVSVDASIGVACVKACAQACPVLIDVCL